MVSALALSLSCPTGFLFQLCFSVQQFPYFYSICFFAKALAEAGFHLSQGSLSKHSYGDPLKPCEIMSTHFFSVLARVGCSGFLFVLFSHLGLDSLSFERTSGIVSWTSWLFHSGALGGISVSCLSRDSSRIISLECRLTSGLHLCTRLLLRLCFPAPGVLLTLPLPLAFLGPSLSLCCRSLDRLKLRLGPSCYSQATFCHGRWEEMKPWAYIP